MKIAFVKPRLVLPARTGGDLHSTQLASALSNRGHDVRFVVGRHAGDGLDGIPVSVAGMENASACVPEEIRGALRRRLYRYIGGCAGSLPAVMPEFLDEQFDVVVGVGDLAPLQLRQLKRAVRVWYAADELVLKTVTNERLRSSLRLNPRKSAISHVIFRAMYERAYGRECDSIWVVTEREQQWMRAFTGHDRIHVLPNGVDLEFFRPSVVDVPEPRVVFWGRLDFPPNIEAIRWFSRKVWPQVRSTLPSAILSVVGMNPTDEVRSMVCADGIELHADVDDLRPVVAAARVAVFPFVSGGGIKNKVLEGAAMGRPLVLSPRAAAGLRGNVANAVMICRRPVDWIRTLQRLLSDGDEAAQCGRHAREWVEANHAWSQTARTAERALETALAKPRT